MTSENREWYFEGLSLGLLTAAAIAEDRRVVNIPQAIREYHNKFLGRKRGIAEMQPGDLGIGMMQPGDLGIEP